MTDTDLGTAAGDIFTKAFTLGYETGREYVPVGGMALTAEQVEDVRALVWLDGRRNFDAFYRLRALFPATEPAEDAKPCGSNSVTLGWCTLSAQHEGLHTNGTYLWGTPSEPDPPAPSEPAEERCQSVSIFRERCALVPGHDGRHAANGYAWGYPPAPAEPAEEETKAEGHDPDALAKRLAWIWHDGWDACGERERGCLRRAAEMAHSHYASSPVVPAPTETEWQTWQEVPEGVQYYGINGWGPTYYVNRGGVRYRVFDDTPSKTADYVVQNFAPFVAAEEG